MLKRYHTRTVAVYLLAWFLLALLYNSIAQLMLMLLVVLFFNYRLDRLRSLKKIISYIIPLALLIVVINALFNQNGELLLTTIKLPGCTMAIYKETIIYGLAMTIKLVLILAVFAAFNQLIPVEKLMDIFGRYSGPAILMAVISARLIPDLAVRASSISQVQRSRGLTCQTGSLAQRIRKLGPLVFNLLRASLQTALQMAEAMQARGYGNGRRSIYCQEIWRIQDWLLLLLTLAVLGLALAGWYTGDGYQNYSPLQQAGLPVRWMEVLPLLFLSLPLLAGSRLSWGKV